MSKKSTNQGTAEAVADTQKQLYTAHQVHALAQLIFHRLAGDGASAVGGFMPPMGAGFTGPLGANGYGTPCPTHNPGFAPHPQPMMPAGGAPILYWYP